jgi:hypothetical protein
MFQHLYNVSFIATCILKADKMCIKEMLAISTASDIFSEVFPFVTADCFKQSRKV